MNKEQDLREVKSAFHGTYTESGLASIAIAIYLGMARIADAIKESKNA